VWLWSVGASGLQGDGKRDVERQAAPGRAKIVFTPEDAKVAPDAGKITNGAFEVMVKPHQARRDPCQPRGVEGRSAMGGAPREAYIPERYNAKNHSEGRGHPWRRESIHL